MTTKLETLPAPDKKSAGAGKPKNHRRPRVRESRGTLAFSRSQRTKALIKHAILILAGGLMIYPLLWMVVSSLRPNDLIFREPGLWLNSLEMSNYTSGWSALTHPFGHYMLNSAIVVIGSILGNLISCSMAAYAFARLQFTGKKLFFGIMLLTIMLPFHVVIVPQYILFSQIGWVNTFWPLLVPKLLATDAFFVFLMVQFIRGIPKDLDEAARIDGAGHPRIFLRVILPLMVPALATTTIFTFIWTWKRLLRRPDLPHGPGYVHRSGSPAGLCRLAVRHELGIAVRHVHRLPPARVPGLPFRPTVPHQGHRHHRHQVKRCGWSVPRCWAVRTALPRNGPSADGPFLPSKRVCTTLL
jgi:multiple sugar transport system permease protein